MHPDPPAQKSLEVALGCDVTNRRGRPKYEFMHALKKDVAILLKKNLETTR